MVQSTITKIYFQKTRFYIVLTSQSNLKWSPFIGLKLKFNNSFVFLQTKLRVHYFTVELEAGENMRRQRKSPI
jgi:hypothetical protein